MWKAISKKPETAEETKRKGGCLGKLGRGRMGSMKSFKGKPEPRRLGTLAIIATMLVSLFFLSVIKARCSTISHPEKLEAPLQLKSTATNSVKMVTDEIIEDEDEEVATSDTSKPICSESSLRSNTCEAEGDVRVEGSTTTIYIPSTNNQEWKIKPYPRKGDAIALYHVKEWSFKPLSGGQPPPACTQNYTVPAVLFSLGGFTGNMFHDFTDIMVPLFATTYQFRGEVQLLVSDLKTWWVSKFVMILRQLSNYEVIEVDATGNGGEVRCFPRVIVGPMFHKELGVDAAKTPTGYSIVDFKALLRKALGLQRVSAMTEGIQVEGMRTRPRLLIISRKNSRAFTNVRGMVSMATSLGFEVRVGEPEVGTDVSKFARLVNSADVMIGVHGAGLTNMLYLPEGAVLIQVIPFGGLEWLARRSFEEPAADMKLHYFEYVIQAEESSLIEQYPRDHPVLRDPSSVHKKGWNALKEVYLDKQNVKPHLGRLRDTLMEALKVLPHTSSHST